MGVKFVGGKPQLVQAWDVTGASLGTWRATAAEIGAILLRGGRVIFL